MFLLDPEGISSSAKRSSSPGSTWPDLLMGLGVWVWDWDRDGDLGGGGLGIMDWELVRWGELGMSLLDNSSPRGMSGPT